jgi:hypothetical protein
LSFATCARPVINVVRLRGRILAKGHHLSASDSDIVFQANCTSDITKQFSACRFGVQCFCTNPDLYKLGQQCWQSNCTIREASSKPANKRAFCAFDLYLTWYSRTKHHLS